MNRKFKISDLDQERFEAKIDSELEMLWANPDSRIGTHTGKPRTKNEMRRDLRQGLAAEQYLIEKLGFKNDRQGFRDVRNQAGISCEVKTAISKDKLIKHLDIFAGRKRRYPTNSDYVCTFIVDIQTSDDYAYEFEGMYKWNGTTFELFEKA